MNALVVVFSYHHLNTEKVAQACAKTLSATVVHPSEISAETVSPYNLVGFGSGIYNGQHHPDLLALVDRLSSTSTAKAFLFSTNGVPARFMNQDAQQAYIDQHHATLREHVHAKGYKIIDEFTCPGYNTNSFLRYLGGLNRHHPDATDLNRAETFAARLHYLTTTPKVDK